MKQVETDTIMKDSRDGFEKYSSLSLNYIDSALEINGRFYINRIKSAMSHFDIVHCGVGILSMFKRVMNKVFPCCDDCSIKLYYQATDSIHLNYDDVNKMVEKCKQQYGQELVGTDLGQFHEGFSMEDAKNEIYGVESLLLGEKHIGILESTDNDGNTLNSEHIRCRGIPASCIQCKASQDKHTCFIYNNSYIYIYIYIKKAKYSNSI